MPLGSLDVASVAAVATRPRSQPIYRPRGSDPLGTLLRRRFPAFQDAYEQSPAATYGRFRLPLIAQVTLHVPPRGKHLVRRYGLYSSRSRGTTG